MNWTWTNTPKAPLAPIPSDGEGLPQESLQLLKDHCPPLGGSWREILELKVNLMQLIITGNYALNSITLGLIIYQVRDGKWKKKIMCNDRQATCRRESWLKVNCYPHQALRRRRRWMCLNSLLSSQFLLLLLLLLLHHKAFYCLCYNEDEMQSRAIEFLHNENSTYGQSQWLYTSLCKAYWVLFF